jgi:thiosulfate dehydrogenase
MRRRAHLSPVLAIVLMVPLMGACNERAEQPRVTSSASPSGAAQPESIPAGPMGEAIRRGRAILLATRESLPGHVGNDLRCVSCHLDEGRRPYAMPWTGVYARFPQYRSRSASVQSLEDRINDCFERSLAGVRLPEDSPAMRAMVAYMAWLSRGVPVGARVPGQGLDSVTVQGEGGSPERGRLVYAAQCSRCHGDNGEGKPGFPAVWGERSFTIGAGMARERAAAAFIRANMPYDRPRSLTPQEAVDVAAFLGTQPRRDFPGKANDWPRGGGPPDVPYRWSPDGE